MSKIKIWPADTEFSKAVRLSRGSRCEHCGRSDGKLECAHIVGRREKSLRWCVDNALCLCFKCHLDFTGDPLDFTDWLTRYLGQGHLDLLQEKRRSIFKNTPAVRKLIAAHYRAEIKLLEAGGHDLVSYQ